MADSANRVGIHPLNSINSFLVSRATYQEVVILLLFHGGVRQECVQQSEIHCHTVQDLCVLD